eukprot:gene18466-24176_t
MQRRIVTSKLSFKGDSNKPKPIKRKIDVIDSKESNKKAINNNINEDQDDNYEVKIQQGTGRITSSGTTIQGHYTTFMDELSPGDAIMISHPTTLQEETKIVTMVLSNTSIGVSTAFSTDLISTTSFKYIKAPKDKKAEEIKSKEDEENKKKTLERDAFGTYASDGGQNFVYRVKKEGSYGGYKIYESDEPVVLWVNTVGPYHNPQETYPYYQLPFCKPSFGIETHKRPSGIGEILEGNELRNSGLKLHFPVDVDKEDVCDQTLDKSTAAEFELAVDRQYWYELFLDDLPMWGMVGETLRDDTHGRMEKHIFTHRTLHIAYNSDRILEVNLTSENPVPIEEGRYAKEDDFDMEVGSGIERGASHLGEDSGWKQVHGDVFRAPDNLVLFSAFIGTGWQLSTLVLGVILYAMAGPYLHGAIYEDRGEMVSTFIVCFALSSFIAGLTSGSYYRQHFVTNRSETNSQWQLAMVYTVILFPSIVSNIIFVLNLISIYYDTISAIPLAIGGTIIGRHWFGKNDPPCRINSIPRPIPVPNWYSDPSFIIPITGLLPFGSIFIEMYYVFSAFWSYKFYYVYGFMLLISYYFGYMGLFCIALFFMCGTIGHWGTNIFVRKIYSNVKID